MTPDDIKRAVELAKSATREPRKYGEAMQTHDELLLARALLAVMPVVEAAREWRDVEYPHDVDLEWVRRHISRAEADLVVAIDALDKAGAK